MSIIPYLSSHLEKRSGKEESFGIIKRSINGEVLTDHDWAILYSYFLPPKPKKITSPFEWVSMVCDQKESYAFCKYVLVEDNKSIAANTKVAHILFNTLDLDEGWYDIKKGNAGDDVAIMPDVMKALDESYGGSFEFDIDKFNNGLFDIVDAPTGLAYILPWNKKGVDKKYFDLMIKSLNNVTIQFSEDGPFRVTGVINGINCVSIIMPFKIHGLKIGNEDKDIDQIKDKIAPDIEEIKPKIESNTIGDSIQTTF